MATQKRRVLYMSDEEWTELERRAEASALTISAYVRNLIVVAATAQAYMRHDGSASGRELDQALSPRVEFRPVPKPSQRGK